MGRGGGARTGGLAGGGPRPCVGSGAAAERRRRWRREPRPRDKREGAGRRAVRVAALRGAGGGRAWLGGRERRSRRLPQESRAGGSSSSNSSSSSRDARLPLAARRREAGEHREAAAASSCGSGRLCPEDAGGSAAVGLRGTAGARTGGGRLWGGALRAPERAGGVGGAGGLPGTRLWGTDRRRAQTVLDVIAFKSTRLLDFRRLTSISSLKMRFARAFLENRV